MIVNAGNITSKHTCDDVWRKHPEIQVIMMDDTSMDFCERRIVIKKHIFYCRNGTSKLPDDVFDYLSISVF